ncbi:Hsp70 family protein [Dactylosporangium salmoneum]|uniref:Hsp70 protein n=1 Tax=Dactylosporangium salmoneum TaxID=53361 RepID=A0ABP5UWD7_9ACTN
MIVPTSVLAIDFGTSSTVAVLARDAAGMVPLLFDASPLLGSAVFAGPDGALLTGADADRAAAGEPAGYEPNPKRRIGDGTVWLGEREVDVVDLVAAVLARGAGEAHRVLGGPPGRVVLTYPATWSQTRVQVLAEAARRAGLGAASLVTEPVAAAAYFTAMLGQKLSAGRCVLVYDLGAGTFDVSLVRRSADGFEVVATDGLPDVGGLDLDAAVVDHARSVTRGAATAWQRLDWPQSAADQRARRVLWHNARSAKEQLTRHATATLHLPLVEQELTLTREEFEQIARPHLEHTVATTVSALRASGIPPEHIEGLFLVGGASRTPLAATLLHQRLGIAPTVIEQPELVVAQGSLCAVGPGAPATTAAQAPPLTPPAGTVPSEIPAVTPPRPSRPVGVRRGSDAADGAVALWRRTSVRMVAAAVALIVVLAGLLAWNADLLPGSGPSSAAGVSFGAAGQRNAKLFASTDLLDLAAPWLNDATCAKKPAFAGDTETVECKADTCCWVALFEMRQSDGAHADSRTAAHQDFGKTQFKAVTYTAAHPRSGQALTWIDKEQQQCRVYWDDDNSRAIAELHQLDGNDYSDSTPLLCWGVWVVRLHPQYRDPDPTSS